VNSRMLYVCSNRTRACFDFKHDVPTATQHNSETYAKKVILKTKDDELSELKSLTDAKGDIHSLHKLVYQDIKDVAIREEVSRQCCCLPVVWALPWTTYAEVRWGEWDDVVPRSSPTCAWLPECGPTYVLPAVWCTAQIL